MKQKLSALLALTLTSVPAGAGMDNARTLKDLPVCMAYNEGVEIDDEGWLPGTAKKALDATFEQAMRRHRLAGTPEDCLREDALHILVTVSATKALSSGARGYLVRFEALVFGDLNYNGGTPVLWTDLVFGVTNNDAAGGLVLINDVVREVVDNFAADYRLVNP